MVNQKKQITDYEQKTPVDGNEKVVCDVAGSTMWAAVSDIADYMIDDSSTSSSRVWSANKANNALTTHTGDATIHRSINDSGSANTDLWSASKITTELATKSATGHTHTASDVTDFSEAVDDRVSALITGNSNEITTSYNDGAGTLTISTPYTNCKMLAKGSVSLITAATTTLFTVPTGKTLYVTDIWFMGEIAISGGTATTLKVGTAANSYAELINGSTGHTFTSGTASTLLAVDRRVRVNDVYSPSAMSSAEAKKFAAGSIIAASTSGGTPVTAGQIIIEIWGYLA